MQKKEKIYKNTQINTANPLKIILMLYERAINDLETAIKIVKDGKELIKANEKVIHAQEIILELIATLDLKQGGEVAKQLLSIYSYINKELSNVLMSKSYENLDNLKDNLKELHSSWAKINSEGDNKFIEKNTGINIVS